MADFFRFRGAALRHEGGLLSTDWRRQEWALLEYVDDSYTVISYQEDAVIHVVNVGVAPAEWMVRQSHDDHHVSVAAVWRHLVVFVHVLTGAAWVVDSKTGCTRPIPDIGLGVDSVSFSAEGSHLIVVTAHPELPATVYLVDVADMCVRVAYPTRLSSVYKCAMRGGLLAIQGTYETHYELIIAQPDAATFVYTVLPDGHHLVDVASDLMPVVVAAVTPVAISGIKLVRVPRHPSQTVMSSNGAAVLWSSGPQCFVWHLAPSAPTEPVELDTNLPLPIALD